MKRIRLTAVLSLAAVLAFAGGCETFRTKPAEEVVDDYALARRMMAEEDYQGASGHLERAAADPKGQYRTDALLLLGDCRMKLKDYAGAQQAYQQAQVKPRTRAINAKAKAGLGDAMTAQKRYVEAADVYEKALAVSEKDINASQTMLRLGKAYIRSGRWDIGRDRLTKLVNTYPRSPEVHEARDIITMPSDTFAVQVGAYASRSNAEEMVATLRKNNIVGARIVDRSYTNAPFAVRVKHFVDYDEALKEAERLKPIAAEAYVVP